MGGTVIRADVSLAYAAWDTAFNKGDAKALASAYVSNAKLLPPTHEVAAGPAGLASEAAGTARPGTEGKESAGERQVSCPVVGGRPLDEGHGGFAGALALSPGIECRLCRAYADKPDTRHIDSPAPPACPPSMPWSRTAAIA